MAGYDGRGARFNIVAVEGNDLSFTVTAVDDAAAAINLSAATITASIYNGAGTVIDTLTDAVSGAGSNIITLSLTDAEVDALTEPKSWALVVERGGDARTWLAGSFTVSDAARAKGGTSGTALTATVDTDVTVTVNTIATVNDAHITDTVDAHDASAISILDTAGHYTATDVEGALAELPGQYVALPAVEGTVGQAVKIASLSPLVTEWGDAGSTSTSGYDDPLYRWRQAFYDDPSTAKMVLLGDSTSYAAGNASSLFAVLREYVDVGAHLSGMAEANIIDGGNNGSTLAAWLSDAAGANSANYSWADMQADAPDLVVASWGINDVRQGATTRAQLIASIEAMIDLIQGTLTSTDILLRIPNSFTTTVVSTDYVDGITHQDATDILREAHLYFVGRYPNVDVIDMQADVFGITALTASPYMSDEIHPSSTGYARVARRLAEHVGHPLSLGFHDDEFYGFGLVSNGGTNFFDISPPFSTALTNNNPGGRPVAWPISTSDALVLSTYGRLSMSTASFGTTGGDVLRVTITGSWSGLIGQTVSLSHSREPGIQRGRVSLTIDPPSVAAGAFGTITATISGVTVSENGVVCQPPTSFTSLDLVWNAYVSAANTVTVKYYNPTAAPIDPAISNAWRFWVAY